MKGWRQRDNWLNVCLQHTSPGVQSLATHQLNLLSQHKGGRDKRIVSPTCLHSKVKVILKYKTSFKK